MNKKTENIQLFLEDIDQVKKKISEGYSYAMLAEEYNLNPLTIGKYCRENGISSICRKVQMRTDNPSKNIEVQDKISKSVKKLWNDGVYDSRTNGMKGKLLKDHPNFKNGTWFYKEKYNFYNPNEELKCECCGKTIEEGKIDIHHIDENHNNHLITNLQALCVDCHMNEHLENKKGPFCNLTKTFEFDSGHYLPEHDGKCFFFHGHRYKLEINIKRRVNRKKGFGIDLGFVSKLVKEKIIDIFDHEIINNYITNPTCENIIIWVWNQLSPYLKGISKITLWESSSGSVTITAEDFLELVENYEQESEWVEFLKKESLDQIIESNDVIIKFKKEDERAIIPTIAYGNSSACFDLIAIEDVKIPAGKSAFGPNGLKVMVPNDWFLEFADRSGNGINKDLRVHPGIIDSGYAGPLSVKIWNLGDKDQIIEKGKGICQVKVMKKWKYKIEEATEKEWNDYINLSQRKENGFGSSDNKKGEK